MIEVPLTRGLVAVIDDEDAAAVLAAGPWHAVPGATTHYARRAVWSGGRAHQVSLHTFLTGWSRVDHADGDGLNNRRANLRPATNAQNGQNRAIQRNNASGYKGVSWHRGAWRAVIWLDGRSVHLGRYADPADAARAYDAAAREAFGEFARVNFPEVTA